ncbi:MAG: PIN domain-containing protein [Pseudomonadota bacterium]|nr:PIN domain-containing protein [Pseudomonadota bacterium]
MRIEPCIESIDAGTPAPDTAARAALPACVLDTNIVLAWLLFEDPQCRPLAAAITGGAVRWLASTPMRRELGHVLQRGFGARRGANAVLEGWNRWACIVEPWDRPSLRHLLCSDSDDQKFIDLAVQVQASALVSRDRAVLKLAKRASRHRLSIVSLGDWTPP